MKGSICISWGKYGGFYFHRGYTKRLCLGFISITYMPFEIDEFRVKAEKAGYERAIKNYCM